MHCHANCWGEESATVNGAVNAVRNFLMLLMQHLTERVHAVSVKTYTIYEDVASLAIQI